MNNSRYHTTKATISLEYNLYHLTKLLPLSTLKTTNIHINPIWSNRQSKTFYKMTWQHSIQSIRLLVNCILIETLSLTKWEVRLWSSKIRSIDINERSRCNRKRKLITKCRYRLLLKVTPTYSSWGSKTEIYRYRLIS